MWVIFLHNTLNAFRVSSLSSPSNTLPKLCQTGVGLVHNQQKKKHKEKKSYMHCLSHSVILGLLRGEAFVGSVASFSQPCLLLKALNALLSLLWNGQEHTFTKEPPQAVLEKATRVATGNIIIHTYCDELTEAAR